MIKLALMNGKEVEVSQEEVMRYLKDQSSLDDLKKIARYILIYEENLSFTGYLFDKADGEPERTKEFNMPAVKKLRKLYQKVRDGIYQTIDISQDVHEMVVMVNNALTSEEKEYIEHAFAPARDVNLVKKYIKPSKGLSKKKYQRLCELIAKTDALWIPFRDLPQVQEVLNGQ